MQRQTMLKIGKITIKAQTPQFTSLKRKAKYKAVNSPIINAIIISIFFIHFILPYLFLKIKKKRSLAP